MDLVIAGIELAAFVTPTVGALLILARQRAIGAAQHRAEMNALRVAIVGETLSPVAFSSLAANTHAHGSDIDSGYGSLEQTRTRRVSATPRSMAEVVRDILAGRYADAGPSAPLTTAEQRDVLVSCLPDEVFDARASALEIGLVPRRAEELPAATPFQLLRGVLLYRPGVNEEAWILGGVATRLLARSGLPWNEADVWLLARGLARGFSLLDVDVVSQNVSA